MPKSVLRVRPDRPPELIQAEREGQDLLHNYCRIRCAQQELINATGMQSATISRMANYKTPIAFEAAVLLDVATDGKLPAEKLCPSRADLLLHFLKARGARSPETAEA